MIYLTKLLENSRFYILAGSVTGSIVAFCLLRIYIPSDQLFYIRAQQVYGLAAIILIYSAVILTPISKIFKGQSWLPGLLFARRAIGVSGAYFSILHTVIAVVDQVGGLSNLVLLPERFRVSFILGFAALLILILMAATSFDKVIEFMTFKRWKMLHRFIYAAGLLIIVHVWLIGTHADETSIRVAGGVALLILFGLEAIRIAKTIAFRYGLSFRPQVILSIAIFCVMGGSLALLPLLSKNYHSDHHSETDGIMR